MDPELPPLGVLPPELRHSVIEEKGVKDLVRTYQGLVVSWQMPDPDFFTAGSCAANTGNDRNKVISRAVATRTMACLLKLRDHGNVAFPWRPQFCGMSFQGFERIRFWGGGLPECFSVDARI